MLITAIEERKKSMTALFIDGEYAVSIDTVTFMSSGKKVGVEITDEELYELIENSNVSRAKEKALYLIEYRSRTRREIMDRLVPLYGENAAGLAVERLEELGLINDEKYAREYAENLLFKKKFSRERTIFEMSKRGIDKDVSEDIIDEIAPDPIEQIKELLETKFARNISDEKGRAKTINSLKTMGYRWSDINNAMSEYNDSYYEY